MKIEFLTSKATVVLSDQKIIPSLGDAVMINNGSVRVVKSRVLVYKDGKLVKAVLSTREL